MDMKNQHIFSKLHLQNHFQLAVDIEVVLCEHFGTLIDGFTGTVKDTTQHIFRYRDPERVAREGDVRLLCIDTGGTFENLNRFTCRKQRVHAYVP